MTTEKDIEDVRSRFHEEHNVRKDGIKTMDEYLQHIQGWMGHNYKDSYKQAKMTVKIANKDGIKGTAVRYHTIQGKIRIRDYLTGRFTSSKPEEVKQTPKGAGEGIKSSQRSKRKAESQDKARKFTERQVKKQ